MMHVGDRVLLHPGERGNWSVPTLSMVTPNMEIILLYVSTKFQSSLGLKISCNKNKMISILGITDVFYFTKILGGSYDYCQWQVLTYDPQRIVSKRKPQTFLCDVSHFKHV